MENIDNPMNFVQDSFPLDALFVISPVIGYIPQLVARDILFSPLTSMFFVMSNILKLFHYNAEKYPMTLFLQSVFVIVLHMSLVFMNDKPLGTYEAKVFEGRTTRIIYKNYGVRGCVLGMLCAFIFSVNLFGIVYGSYKPCGAISSVLELSVNFFQLIAEKEEKKNKDCSKNGARRSPKELYLCWIIGDIAKIWFMLNIETPLVFVGTVFSQVFIDLFLLFS